MTEPTQTSDIARQYRNVKLLTAANATLVAALALVAFGKLRPGADAVITAERINIVDSTGVVRLAIANAARLPGGTFGGKEYPQSFTGRGRSAGLIFFNEIGDEVGGLIYEGAPRDSSWRAFGHLSFDQWQQNQVVAMQYRDNGASRSAGVRVWDRPTDAPLEMQFSLAERMLATPPGPVRDSLNQERLIARQKVAGVERLFLGSSDRTAELEMRDRQGTVRVRLFVDEDGSGRLEFLDENGNVTSRFPAG